MKAEDDRDLNFGTYWLDEKTGQLLRVESGYVQYSERARSAVYRDKDGDLRKKYIDLAYLGEGPTAARFRVTVTEVRERFVPMGTNPVWIVEEKRWAPTGQVLGARPDPFKSHRAYPR